MFWYYGYEYKNLETELKPCCNPSYLVTNKEKNKLHRPCQSLYEIKKGVYQVLQSWYRSFQGLETLTNNNYYNNNYNNDEEGRDINSYEVEEVRSEVLIMPSSCNYSSTINPMPVPPV